MARNRIIREVVGLQTISSELASSSRRNDSASKLLSSTTTATAAAGVTLSWGTASLASRSGARLSSRTNADDDALRRTRLRRQRSLNGAPAATSFSEWTRNRNDLRKRLATEHDFERRRRVVVAYIRLRSTADTEIHRAVSRSVQISNRAFQLLVGAEYGVRWIDTFELSRMKHRLRRELPGGNDLYPQARDPSRSGTLFRLSRTCGSTRRC